MTPHVVVDIGNTRMKWGHVAEGRVTETAALGRYPNAEWQEVFDRWGIESGSTWLVASVDPYRTTEFTRWLGEREQFPVAIRSYRQIPLALDVDVPEGVGLDRLLACLGALGTDHFPPPFLVVQAGTALVVNFVNAEGVFVGGAILPGFALMAKALNEQTAQLPGVSIEEMTAMAPGRNTEAAIRLGMLSAALGTIRNLRESVGTDPLPVFLTGGDAGILRPHVAEPVALMPDLVPEGLRITAERMP